MRNLIETAAGRKPADLVLKNCKIVNVYSGEIESGDIAITDGKIAGIGDYDGKEIIDAEGKFAAPGFIDAHIHIESSYISPEHLGKIIVPCGMTTIIADPHEIVNVCGLVICWQQQKKLNSISFLQCRAVYPQPTLRTQARLLMRKIWKNY